MRYSGHSVKKLPNSFRYSKQNVSSRIFYAEPLAWQTIEIGDNWVIKIHILPGKKPGKIQVS
jgi:hypothetical protein